MSPLRLLVLGAALALATAVPAARAAAPPSGDTFETAAASRGPAGFDGVEVVEHTGAKIPLDLRFRDSQGRDVDLASSFHHHRPVILSLVYFDCPMLCSNVLAGLVRAAKEASVASGVDADFLTVSFNPEDKVSAAAFKRTHYVQSLGLDPGGPGWPFFTGDQTNIRALAEALGFRYARIANTSEFAHAAVIFVLTENGVISRYLYGIDLPSRDLRLALLEASQGRFGNAFDKFLLLCYRFDPASRRYAPFLSAYFKIGGLVLLLVVGGALGVLWRRDLARGRGKGGVT